jgi:rhodanese-related sulfurtransferase
MIRWIENVSRDAVRNGQHFDAGPNAMLIQISDPPGNHPTPKYNFKEVHGFDFLDAEDADGFDDDFKISDEQAAQIVGLLQHALDNSMNVVVHCHAGICRSGAVVEVATMMGFTATERLRIPNMRVKHRMMKALGWTYDADEKTTPVNGYVSTGGVVMPMGEWE